MESRRTRASFLAGLAIGLVGCASAAPGDPRAFPSEALSTISSDSGKLSIEVRTAPSQPPVRGVVSVELRVHETDGKPVDGLVLDAKPWMAAMGHGGSVVPDVEVDGSGRYVLTNVDFFMPGRWQLQTDISGTVTDHAAPEFQIP